MTLFLGTHHNKLDKKGRVSIPAPFRALLGKLDSPDLVLVPNMLDPCVDCWPQEDFERFSRREVPENPLSNPRSNMMMATFAMAVGVCPDVEGRVVLPGTMVAHAGLTDTVSFASVGPYFQIWAPEALEERQRAASEKMRARLQALRDLEE